MLAATFLAIFFVPLFFVLIGKIKRPEKPQIPEKKQSLEDEEPVRRELP
jgi:hypothetical protein